MTITDVRLRLFAGDDIPATPHGHHTGKVGGTSRLGRLTIATDKGIDGHDLIERPKAAVLA